MKVINNVNDLESHLKSKNKIGKDVKLSIDENEEIINKNDNSENQKKQAKITNYEKPKKEEYHVEKFSDNLEQLEELDKCKTRLLKYIVYKKRTKSEIRKKFSSEFDENLLEEAISSLEENGYINDENYIKRSVDEFMAIRTLSLKEIKYKLLSKGLTSNEIDSYFDKNEDVLNSYEEKCAIKIAKKRQAQGDEEFQIRQFLAKKGYKSDSIKNAIETL